MTEYTPVTSSNVEAVRHEGDVLFVKYKNGSEYKYLGVSEGTYDDLLKATSVGKFINGIIKPNYSFERI